MILVITKEQKKLFTSSSVHNFFVYKFWGDSVYLTVVIYLYFYNLECNA